MRLLLPPLYWLVLVALLPLSACQEPESTLPIRQDITESIYAPGRVVDEAAYAVHAPVSGILTAWEVAEGDTVAPGTVLGRIDSDVSSLNVSNAQLQLETAQDQLRRNSPLMKELDLNIQMARLKWENDSSLHGRQQVLWQQGIGSQAELDARRLAMETSYKQWQAAQKRKALQVDQLTADVSRARNLLAIASDQQKDFLLESRIHGLVRQQMLEPGELVSPQMAVALIGSLNGYRIELEIDETDILQLRLGQMAVVSLDAYPGELFDAKIVEINSQINLQTQAFTVTLEFVRAPARLLEGMTAEANILLRKKEAALLIPRAYLIGNDQVLTGESDTTTIQIGLKDLKYVEVLEGLTEKTRIYLP